MALRAGKKRKAEVDLDAERTLYTSFVSAANTVSQLYTQAVAQQRKTGAAAARQSLERIICLILKEFQHTEVIPKTALLQYLQQEYEYTEGSEHAPQQYPAQFLAPISPGAAAAVNVQGAESEPAHKTARGHPHAPASSSAFTNPPAAAPRRAYHHHHPAAAAAAAPAASGGSGAAMDAMAMEPHGSGMDATQSSSHLQQGLQGGGGYAGGGGGGSGGGAAFGGGGHAYEGGYR